MRKTTKHLLWALCVTTGVFLVAFVLMLTRPYRQDHWRSYVRFAHEHAEEFGLDPEAFAVANGYSMSRFEHVMKKTQNVEFKDYLFLTVTTAKGLADAKTIGILGMVIGPRKRSLEEMQKEVEPERPSDS